MIYEIDINPEDLEEKLPAGKNKFIDRIDWAKSVLKEAGLISRPKHGYWTLTQKGIDLALENRSLAKVVIASSSGLPVQRLS
ncbi:mrr N-terminal domain protein [Acinetobacter baumannii 348935]|nr:mrr N-terminal domain protein [Acinetobacter baumannii 348935]